MCEGLDADKPAHLTVLTLKCMPSRQRPVRGPGESSLQSLGLPLRARGPAPATPTRHRSLAWGRRRSDGLGPAVPHSRKLQTGPPSPRGRGDVPPTQTEVLSGKGKGKQIWAEHLAFNKSPPGFESTCQGFTADDPTQALLARFSQRDRGQQRSALTFSYFFIFFIILSCEKTEVRVVCALVTKFQDKGSGGGRPRPLRREGQRFTEDPPGAVPRARPSAWALPPHPRIFHPFSQRGNPGPGQVSSHWAAPSTMS